MLHGNPYRMSRLRVREPARLLFNRLMLRTHEMVVVAKCPLWLQASVTSAWRVPGTGIPSFAGRKSACFTFAEPCSFAEILQWFHVSPKMPKRHAGTAGVKLVLSSRCVATMMISSTSLSQNAVTRTVYFSCSWTLSTPDRESPQAQ